MNLLDIQHHFSPSRTGYLRRTGYPVRLGPSPPVMTGIGASLPLLAFIRTSLAESKPPEETLQQGRNLDDGMLDSPSPSSYCFEVDFDAESFYLQIYLMMIGISSNRNDRRK